MAGGGCGKSECERGAMKLDAIRVEGVLVAALRDDVLELLGVMKRRFDTGCGGCASFCALAYVGVVPVEIVRGCCWACWRVISVNVCFTNTSVEGRMDGGTSGFVSRSENCPSHRRISLPTSL